MATAELLAGLVRSAFGSDARLRHVNRLRGATKKGVYRVVLDGGSTAIVYVWDPGEDYWPSADGSASRADADAFSHASGLDLFCAAHDRLGELGIRVPRLYLADASREHYPADAAVVEDVAGPSLEHIIGTEPHRAAPAMQQLSEMLRALHADRAAAFGKLLPVTSGRAAAGGASRRPLRQSLAEPPSIVALSSSFRTTRTDPPAGAGRGLPRSRPRPG